MLFSSLNPFYGHNQSSEALRNNLPFYLILPPVICLSLHYDISSITGTLHKISLLHELPSPLSLNYYLLYIFNSFWSSFRTQLSVDTERSLYQTYRNLLRHPMLYQTYFTNAVLCLCLEQLH